MIELSGKYNTAKVFTDNIDEGAVGQIIQLCNNLVSYGSNIAIMPDVHAGKGCTIGTTMTITDKIVPNLVGVDIGCGVNVVPITVAEDFDWIKELNKTIRIIIPSGTRVRNKPHKFLENIPLYDLRCIDHVNLSRIEKSVGTLGGGNHYIEVNYDELGRYYLTVHSGSRSLGKEVAEFYQNKAYKILNDTKSLQAQEIQYAVRQLQKSNQTGRIESVIQEIKDKYTKVIKLDKQLAYLQGSDMEDYFHDMLIATEYAYWNRSAITHDIIHSLLGRIDYAADDWAYSAFSCVHNYIDFGAGILRKGAVSAQDNELIIIPISMRDGSIIAVGKGNPDWNYSAPHGAGRLLSRSSARKEVSLDMFVESMDGIFTTSVNNATIDECCFAYKDIDEILNNIGDTVDVIRVIKPIYNFKSSY